MSKSIAVAICTYNGEKYLAEQLESIISQTVQPNEIVICDDCSKDESIDVAKKTLAYWQGKTKIVKNDNNLGYKLNFQKAITLCESDIIFLCDQDDIWHQDKIQKIMAVFEEYKNTIMVFHDVNIVNEKLEIMQTSFWRQLQFIPEKFINGNYDILYRHNVVQGASCAFKRELFEFSKPFCKEAHHDEWLALVAQTKWRIIPYNENLADYRQTGNNALGSGDNRISAKLHRWIEQLKQTAKNHICELKRRDFVLSDFMQKYNALSPLGEKYLPFLKKRIKQKLHINIIQYMCLECNLWSGIKEFVKDNLTNIVLRAEHNKEK